MALRAERWAALGALLLLGGCGGGERGAAPTVAPPPPSAVADTPVQVGATYSIGGNSYTPEDVHDYDTVGYASWYGQELAGRNTANGEAFRPEGVSAAHRTLPMPSYVEVTRLDTGRTILVRVNDRGPADPNRLIDLSAGAAEELGIASQGAVPVRVRRTFPVDAERLALRSGRAVPPRLDTPESLLAILRERAAQLPRPAGMAASAATPPTPAVTPTPATPSAARPTPATRPTAPARPAPPTRGRGNVPATPSPTAPTAPAASGARTYIVQAGSFSSRARAEALARRLHAEVVSAGNVHRVRYGPFATEAEARAAVARARALGQPGAVILRAP